MDYGTIMKKGILLPIFLGVFIYLNCGNPFSGSDNVQDIIELSQLSAVSKIHFIDSNIGWAIGNNGNLLETTDGGRNWGKVGFPSEEDLIAIKFVNKNVGWISTENAVYKTNDNGEIWTSQLEDSTLSIFNTIDFIDTSNGWVAGPPTGSLYKTENGGNLWISTKITIGRIVNIHFVNNNDGWIVSAGSKIFRTNNGGKSWEIANHSRSGVRLA
jgi:photosystem II stability/assembly factor-like uncharacterized protein